MLRFLRVFQALFFWVVGSIMIWSSMGQSSRETLEHVQALQRSGRSVQAKITDLRSGDSMNPPRASYEFKLNEQTYGDSSPVSPQRFKGLHLDGILQVFYLPDDPKISGFDWQAMQDDADQNRKIIWIFEAVISGVSILAIVLGLSRRRVRVG